MKQAMLPVHPIALSVPEQTQEEYAKLRESMKRGFDPLKPIVLYEGKVLDGRSRQEAAAAEGVDPVYVDWRPSCEEDTPAQFVARCIMHRTLTQQQKERVWAKLVPVLLADIQAEATQRMRAGKPAPKAAGASRAAPSREIVAARVGAGRPTVDAIVHAMKAAPDLLRDLQEGKVTIAQAKATLRKPPERPKKPAVDKSVPAEAVEAIGAAGKFKDLATRIRSIRREVEELALTKEGVELNLILNRVTGALDTAAGSIKFAAPYVPCPFFPNCETGTCKMCRGKKWITRTLHSTLSPQMKEDSLAMIGKPSDSQ